MGEMWGASGGSIWAKMKGLACIWHYPAIGARLMAQGCTSSRSAQSAISSSSFPKAAARCTPTGNPPADMLNRWFSHYLYGVDNGVPGDQSAYIVQDAAAQAPMAAAAPSGAPAPNPRLRATALPTPFAAFPVPGSVPVTLHPTAGGRGIASLAFAPVAAGAEALIDDVAFSGSALASAATSANRLLYATPVLTDTVHISGTPRVTLRLAANVKAANLSVWLVMLPYDSRDQVTSGVLVDACTVIRESCSACHQRMVFI